MSSTATLPPFPDNVPTHPLLVIDYKLIEQGDQKEIDTLWKAATQLGFWYLKNHGVEELADQMFEMGKETMDLPLSEKMPYEQGNDGTSFGYKAFGANATDEYGSPDTVEFINISKDDALAWPGKAHREYPSAVRARMDSTIKPFVQKSMEVNDMLISVLNDRLGLPKNALAKFHSVDEFSGSETRCIKKPPVDEASRGKVGIGAHTDFGSVSFLHNRLGGLQVLPPGYEDWQYVKPIPGHAICNLGDAMAIFSGGILRSNLHRVVAPPGDQANFERWSLVYFSRPGDTVELRALTELSPMIAEAVAKAPNPELYRPGSTASEWFSRRVKYQRLNNRTGPESWKASRGTEHKPAVI